MSDAKDRESRALGAGTTITVRDKETKKDKDYHLCPIEVRHLCDLEREALEYYKQQYLKTFSDNKELLGDNYLKVLREEMREAAAWDLDDLPKKTAFAVSSIPVTDDLKKWAVEKHAEMNDSEEKEEELTDGKIRALVSTCLDREELTVDMVVLLSGRKPRQGKVRYDQWWVTGAMEGMVAFLYNSIRYEHGEVKREDVRSWPITSIFEGARKVEEITAPNLKNG